MSTPGSGWNNIVGHDWAIHLLRNALANDRIGHAYLFTGINQIGKATLARAFTKMLNCEAEAAQRPCGECRSCVLIDSDRHPDVRVVAPELSDRGIPSIKIEHIRRLQQDLSLSAYEARYKVAIIEQFDTANLNAANAFLKTLEEPPNNVILMLTATDGESLLPTIVSRCRVVALRPVNTALIEEVLMTRWRAQPEEATLLAHLASGRLGWAISFVKDQTQVQTRKHYLDSLYRALQSNLVGRFTLAESLAKKADGLPEMIQVWSCWWRDLAIIAHDRRSQELVTNIDQLDRLHQMAALWPRKSIIAGLAHTETGIRQLKQNANTRLVLENMFLSYPKAPAELVTN